VESLERKGFFSSLLSLFGKREGLLVSKGLFLSRLEDRELCPDQLVFFFFLFEESVSFSFLIFPSRRNSVPPLGDTLFPLLLPFPPFMG